MGSNFPPHRASPFLARAWFANQRRPGGLCLDTEPTSCISPGRPSRDERAVEGQSCSGEWLALTALIPRATLPASATACSSSSSVVANNAGIDKGAVAAPPFVS